MIIKDDKVVEPVAEQVTENPPPYSPPQVRVVGVNHRITHLVQPQSRPASNDSQNQASNVIFRPRGSSSASSAPSSISGAVGVSSSSTYSGPGSVNSGATSSNATLRPSDPRPTVPPPPDVQLTSHFYLRRRNKPVSERLVINPYLPFSGSAQASLNEGAGNDEEENDWPTYGDEGYELQFGPLIPGDPEKRNIFLANRNANVNAEVWLVGRPSEIVDPYGGSGSGRKKAGMDVRTVNGYIRVKLHADAASPAFSLRIACKNGGVRVVLPRTFSGPLTTRTRNGWASLSPELASDTTTFTEARGTRKSFVGDFVDSGYGRGDWPGCSLDITCDNGRIKLCYSDEDTEKALSASSGDKKFFGHIFN